MEGTTVTSENITNDNRSDEPNYKDLYIRSLADYENMKKFMSNKAINARKEALRDFVSCIVAPVYNDLRRGSKNNVDGCDLILSNLKKSVEKYNVAVYDTDDFVNKPFDVYRMEAVSSVPSSKDRHELVCDVIDPCFIDVETGKTIVYAKVIVYNGNI